VKIHNDEKFEQVYCAIIPFVHYITTVIYHIGGLGFSLNNIGVTLAIAGVMLVPLSLTIYMRVHVVKCTLDTCALQLLLLVISMFCITMPWFLFQI